MQPQLLFDVDDLPIPITRLKKPTWANVVKLSKKAVRELFNKMQMNFNDLLNRPVIEVPCDDTQSFEPDYSSNVLTNLSNTHILEMHKWIFEESMESLKEGGNAAEKLDILEWIFSPSYIEKLGKSHDNRPCIIRTHVYDIPFSFSNCCRAVGVRNPDNFREMLVEKMSDDVRPHLEKYLQITQGKIPTYCRKA